MANLEEQRPGLNTANQTVNRTDIIGGTGTGQRTNTSNLNTGIAGSTTAAGGAGSTAGNANAAGGYSGIAGVTPQTGSGLQQAVAGYSPSAVVQQAMSNLQSIADSRPGEYQSRYQTQLDDIYGQIMNRGPFQYDINKDQLYQQAREQYIRGGQQAMMDTMGNASTLTGGYGSSYGSIAGNQAYQQYLTGLNDKLGDYYDRAYQRYQDQGNELMSQYGLAMNADATDYGRYQDRLNQWNTDRSSALGEYSTLAGIDQQNWSTNAGIAMDMANLENGSFKDQRDYAMNIVNNAINKGVLPSESMLQAAGLTTADVYAMVYGAEAAAAMGYPGAMPGMYGLGAGAGATEDDSDSGSGGITGGNTHHNNPSPTADPYATDFQYLSWLNRI